MINDYLIIDYCDTNFSRNERPGKEIMNELRRFVDELYMV